MYFDLTNPLPKKYWIAVSGGVDSMSVLHWLDKPSRWAALDGVVHINHNTGAHANKAERLVSRYMLEKLPGLRFLKFRIEGSPPKGESKEAWWRAERYRIFGSVPGDSPIILGHHFDDCLEEYIMCTLVRGYASTIPYKHDRCIRPFRLWKRKDILKYAKENKVSYLNDPTNDDTRFKRNLIRHEIVPKVLELNPGVYNIVERLIRAEIKHAHL
jgi:tRNA(Ile)-lysidine synthase